MPVPHRQIPQLYAQLDATLRRHLPASTPAQRAALLADLFTTLAQLPAYTTNASYKATVDRLQTHHAALQLEPPGQ